MNLELVDAELGCAGPEARAADDPTPRRHHGDRRAANTEARALAHAASRAAGVRRVDRSDAGGHIGVVPKEPRERQVALAPASKSQALGRRNRQGHIPTVPERSRRLTEHRSINAVAESFFGTLKTELIYTRRFATKGEAREAIFDFIEGYFNPRRRHSTLGYLSPMEFEMKFIEEKKIRKYEAAASSDRPRDRGRLIE
jgi:putative transposase